MKKILASILAVIYLSTSMGATVHLHYCMGRLVSWGLTDHQGKSCDFCGMQKMGPSGECVIGMKNCCHEENKQIKNDKDQKAAQDLFQLMKVVPALAGLQQPVWKTVVVPSSILSQPVSHGPPLMALMPLFLRNCTFRI